jgi:hypothetical protein
MAPLIKLLILNCHVKLCMCTCNEIILLVSFDYVFTVIVYKRTVHGI